MGQPPGARFLRNAVLLRDDVGQFDVGRHALCRVDAEELTHKFDTFIDRQRAAQQQIREVIWVFHASLEAYRTKPK